MPQSPHLGAVPFFLMWRYRSLPPGVLITRTLLDLVLYLIVENIVKFKRVQIFNRRGFPVC